MKNQTQKGDAVTVVAPAGGMVSGNGYLFGSMFGIAAETVAAGVSTTLWLVGCYTLPKNSAEAWTFGALIYWDPVTNGGQCTITPGTLKKIGVATAAASNPSPTGNVRLNGVFTS
ncbi:putative RecA/RadA family phage recombinase [Bradyrhizobium elkanii]|nr:DUF2190 family protein [Bradyrhizobium elkanii]MCS3689079.1 putative RecA/RadA family phage recombinase [Bradyrhizobium elkanii]